MIETELAALMPVVRRAARGRARMNRVDADEMESAAMLGLAVASKKFDGSKRVPFEAFAWMHVQWALINHARTVSPLTRAGRPRPEIFSLNRPVPNHRADDEVSYLHLVEEPRDDLGELEGLMQASWLMEPLSKRQRETVVAHVLDGEPLRVIAERQGVSESRICHIVRNSTYRMRQRLANAA